MVDLDVKDRKILYHLDLNCRQSNAQIGKKVGLSKQVVEYRIKRMEKEGIITGYWAMIDAYRLGYEVYRYYLNFHDATPKKKQEIINYLTEYHNTWVAGSLSGPYDVSAVIWIKSIPEFYMFWETFNDVYGDYFHQKVFSVYLYCDIFRLTCLIPDNYEKKERDAYWRVGPGEKLEIDKLDYTLLNILSLDARRPLMDIAKELGCSSQNTSYRMKKLLDNGLIQAFRASINYEKINLQPFKVDFWLKKLSNRRKMWKYFKDNPCVTFINTSAGNADLEIEFSVNGLPHLISIIEKTYEDFPETIRKHLYFTIIKTHIVRCIPEIKDKDFMK